MRGMKAAVVVLGVVLTGHATAATRDSVRLRLLDQCVMTNSGKTDAEGAGPKCGCYATKITKAMTDEEIAKWRKGVPKRLTEESKQIFAGCK